VAAEKLTALQVKRAKPGAHGDGKGLWLVVGSNGSRSWVFRYMVAGRAREMGLGSAYDVSLAEAREEARKCRRLIQAGGDPIDARRARRLAARLERARAMTFEQCAAAFIEAHEVGWTPRHASAWANTLRDHVFPVIGGMPVQSVDTPLALAVLKPLWATKSVTADRVRSRCEAVIGWATTAGYRAGDNPFRWRDHLENLLAKQSRVHRVEHFDTIPYQELPGFMAQLRSRPGPVARALESAILLTARTGEVIGAEWAEFDFRERIWALPARRRKVGTEDLRLPLCTRMLELLAELPRIAGNPFVFIGEKPGRPISPPAMLALMRRLHQTATVHGTARASFKTWATEATAFPPEIVEMQLGHTVGNAVARAYMRTDLLARRRALAEQWGQFCCSPPRDDNVVQFGGAANG
jgi:integrase